MNTWKGLIIPKAWKPSIGITEMEAECRFHLITFFRKLFIIYIITKDDVLTLYKLKVIQLFINK